MDLHCIYQLIPSCYLAQGAERYILWTELQYGLQGFNSVCHLHAESLHVLKSGTAAAQSFMLVLLPGVNLYSHRYLEKLQFNLTYFGKNTALLIFLIFF